MSTSKPASGLPFEGIGLFLVKFLRISVLPDAVVRDPVGFVGCSFRMVVVWALQTVKGGYFLKQSKAGGC